MAENPTPRFESETYRKAMQQVGSSNTPTLQELHRSVLKMNNQERQERALALADADFALEKTLWINNSAPVNPTSIEGDPPTNITIEKHTIQLTGRMNPETTFHDVIIFQGIRYKIAGSGSIADNSTERYASYNPEDRKSTWEEYLYLHKKDGQYTKIETITESRAKYRAEVEKIWADNKHLENPDWDIQIDKIDQYGHTIRMLIKRPLSTNNTTDSFRYEECDLTQQNLFRERSAWEDIWNDGTLIIPSLPKYGIPDNFNRMMTLFMPRHLYEFQKAK